MVKKKINKNVVIYQAKSGAIELRGDFSREIIWDFRIIQLVPKWN